MNYNTRTCYYVRLLAQIHCIIVYGFTNVQEIFFFLKQMFKRLLRSLYEITDSMDVLTDCLTTLFFRKSISFRLCLSTTPMHKCGLNRFLEY